MKVGIVGFAGAGKTTVFNALTGLTAGTGLGAKGRTNLGMIKVPDPRIEFLSGVYEPKKTTYAEIAFVDVAGTQGSEKGLDTKLVTHMREVDALVQVVRGFENPALSQAPDPLRDLHGFQGDIILTDLMQVETRINRLKKERKSGAEVDVMARLHAQLDSGALLSALELSEQEMQVISGYQFLSLKPCVLLLNQPDDLATAELPQALLDAAKQYNLSILAMAAQAEAEIAELSAEDQQAFLEDLGLEQTAAERFVNTVYAQLDLISFLTSGPDECRAWTITRGINARAAAGKIHSDIERGFIRAEVIAFTDFEEHRSEAKCRDAGKLRSEGKEYIVADGDIINFRFNV